VGESSFKYFLIAGFLALIGCGTGSLEPKEYMGWIENIENGLKKTEKIGDYEFSLQYKPIEYVALVESRDVNIEEETLKSKVAELKDFQYYNLKIMALGAAELLSANIVEEDEYYGRLNYFVTYAQEDIQLIEANDTLPCSLYLFERNYGLANHNNIVLGFKSNNKDADKTVIFNDQVLGTGPVRFKINKEDLLEIPSLKTN